MKGGRGYRAIRGDHGTKLTLPESVLENLKKKGVDLMVLFEVRGRFPTAQREKAV